MTVDLDSRVSLRSVSRVGARRMQIAAPAKHASLAFVPTLDALPIPIARVAKLASPELVSALLSVRQMLTAMSTRSVRMGPVLLHLARLTTIVAPAKTVRTGLASLQLLVQLTVIATSANPARPGSVSFHPRV